MRIKLFLIFVILLMLFAVAGGLITSMRAKINNALDEQAAYRLMGPSEREWNDRVYEMNRENMARERAYKRLHKN